MHTLLSWTVTAQQRRLRSCFSSYILWSSRGEKFALLLFCVSNLKSESRFYAVKSGSLRPRLSPLKLTPSLRPLLRVMKSSISVVISRNYTMLLPAAPERFCFPRMFSSAPLLVLITESCRAKCLRFCTGSPPHNISLWCHECLRMGFCNNTFFFFFVWFLEEKNAKNVHETCFEQISVCLLSLDQRSASPPPHPPLRPTAVFFVCFFVHRMNPRYRIPETTTATCFSQPSVSPLEF